MLNRTLKIAIAVFSLGCAMLAPSAQAQNPPMNMSWAIQSQMNAYNQGQANANAATMYYIRYMQQLRAAGYTGPSLPTGVTNESLRASINAANQAGQAYNRAQFDNSQRRSNATYDYSMRAIRGCTPYVDQYGRVFYAGC
jgi:type II secretory pathway pseudopilin PulG